MFRKFYRNRLASSPQYPRYHRRNLATFAGFNSVLLQLNADGSKNAAMIVNNGKLSGFHLEMCETGASEVCGFITDLR